MFRLVIANLTEKWSLPDTPEATEGRSGHAIVLRDKPFIQFNQKYLPAQQIQDCDQREPSKFASLGLAIVSADAEI